MVWPRELVWLRDLVVVRGLVWLRGMAWLLLLCMCYLCATSGSLRLCLHLLLVLQWCCLTHLVRLLSTRDVCVISGGLLL